MPKLARKLRHDTHDPDRYYLKLTRAKHYCWGELRKCRKSEPLNEERAFREAVEILMRCCAERLAIVEADRKQKSVAIKARFAARKVSRGHQFAGQTGHLEHLSNGS